MLKIKYINHVSSMRHNSHIKIAEINKIRAVKFLKICMKLKRIEFFLPYSENQQIGLRPCKHPLYNLFISRLEAQTLIHPNPISKRDFSGSGPKLSIPNPLGKEYTDLFFHRRYCHQAHHRLRRHAAEDLPELSILKTWY